MTNELCLQANGCIWSGARSMIDIVLQWVTLQTQLEQILVIHKKTPKLVPSNMIGDGFRIPLVFNRKKNDDVLDIQACVSGIVSYTSFNEHSAKTKPYAYKYPKDDLDYLNETFGVFELPVSAVLQDQLIMLHTDMVAIDIHTIAQSISYIYGLMLVYGQFDLVGEDEDILTQVTIRFPLRESFLTVYESLQAQKSHMQTQWLFFSLETQDVSMWQMVVINIDDEELLYIYASWLWWKSRETDIWFLHTYIQEHIPHIAWLCSNSVLKLLQK